MGSWTGEHYKAIANYAKQHDYKIAMGSYPIARFIDQDGKEVTAEISKLVQEYHTNKKDEAKERRRIKQEEENRKPWHERFKQK